MIASPNWDFDDAMFDRTAVSFDNPDHVAIVIHNYRWRLRPAGGETRYDDLERNLKGIGHNVSQEAPHAFAQAVIDVAGY